MPPQRETGRETERDKERGGFTKRKNTEIELEEGEKEKKLQIEKET